MPYKLRDTKAPRRDPETIAAALRELAKTNPRRAQLIELGRTGENRPLYALRISGRPGDHERPAILLVAAHHANEFTTPDYALDAARYLSEHAHERKVRRWLNQLAVVVVPLANPDGAEAFWHTSEELGRKTRRKLAGGEVGVDMNRNYPFMWNLIETRFNSSDPASNFYRGPAPASEPEVQALMALAGRERFVAAISYHGTAGKLLVPYSIDGVENPEPSAAWSVAQEMTARLAAAGARYDAVKSLYPVDGTEQDWYYHRFGTLAYLLEVPKTKVSGADLGAAVVQSRPAWQTLLDRWLSGPSLSVRAVRAGDGAPVEAEVRIAEIVPRAGERWTTSPHTGWLHQMLPAPGGYMVSVGFEGEVVSESIDVGRGVTRVTLKLPAAVVDRRVAASPSPP